jgi:pilus assembly protein FimV
LASREQEAGELKSRVKQLEDLNGKDQRLLTLKESEIADLQNKLKQLQSAKAVVATTPPAAAATKPAETPPASTAKPAEAPAKAADAGAKNDTKLTAKDIWGDISASDKSAPAKPTTPTTTAPAPVASTPAPGASPNPTSPASSSPTTAVTAPAAMPKPDATTPATTPSVAAPPPPSVPSTVTTTPVITPPTSAPVAITTNPPAVKPAAPATTPKPVAPLAAEQPWYQNNMALLAGGVGLLLIGLLALMRFMRKPKPVLMPVAGMDEVDEHAAEVVSEDEHHLLDALAQHPGDPHLSLELLSLYYAQHNATKFEAAAEAMYAHIADPTQPEWQQVQTMGEQLCPHNPLFGGSADLAGAAYGHDDHAGFGHLAGDGHTHDDSFDLGGHDHAAHTAPASDADSFDFDLTDHAAAAAGAAVPAHEMDFSHEQTMIGHPTPPPAAFQAPPAPAPVAPPAEDFFAGEDAIGTKLDLAKAYLDMGDPEGARSMLDEVMAEGNDTQKGEARKLLAEIR